MVPVIPDKNLRLALIDEVYGARRGDADTLYGRPDAPSLDDIPDFDSDPRHHPHVEAYALGLPLTEDDLRAIEDLTLDGDREIYGAAFPDWWDQGDHFVVRSLDGIEACAHLRRLSLGQGIVVGASLAPLTRLPALTYVALCHTGRYPDVERLLELPALEHAWISNVPASAARWHAVLAELRARGVSLR